MLYRDNDTGIEYIRLLNYSFHSDELCNIAEDEKMLPFVEYGTQIDKFETIYRVSSEISNSVAICELVDFKQESDGTQLFLVKRANPNMLSEDDIIVILATEGYIKNNVYYLMAAGTNIIVEIKDSMWANK